MTFQEEELRGEQNHKILNALPLLSVRGSVSFEEFFEKGNWHLNNERILI
jgi:hypothetical protein